MAKILAIDDDAALVDVVKLHLENENHRVECAYDAEQGLRKMQYDLFDLVLLDWELPGRSGLEVCQKYRESGGIIPILMLTARSHIDSKELGYDAGVDDYLTKPFAMKELSMRVRALLKRCTPIVSDLLRIRNIEIDTKASTVRRSGVEVELFRGDFALLEFLMRNPNRVFSAEALHDHVYPSDANFSIEAIRTSIKRIRQKLDDDGSEDSIIKTVHKVGYKVIS